MIGNVGTKDRKYLTNVPIGTHHLHTMSTCSNKRFHEQRHAFVEETVACEGACRLGEAFELGNRYVANENL